MHEVVVTGVGPILARCDSRARMWQQVAEGQSQLSFEAAPGAPGERWPVGRVGELQPEPYLGELTPRVAAFWARYHQDQRLYLASLGRALADAGLSPSTLPTGRTGLYDGSSRQSFDGWYARIRGESERAEAEAYTGRDLMLGTPGQAASLAACLLGTRGPAYTLTATCASGAVATGLALRDLASGEVDVALASGHDSALSRPIHCMYRDTGLLSGERAEAGRAVRAFQEHSRNAFGEGAVTLVLETAAHARRRGARPLALLRGYGYGNHAQHPTSVDPSGARAAEVIIGILERARFDRERVGFVLGHGNGVPQSDLSELAYMKQVFGPRGDSIPLLTTKPIWGHTLGASSAVNLAVAALMLSERRVAARPGEAGGTRPLEGSAGLVVSFGIGGHIAALLLEAP